MRVINDYKTLNLYSALMPIFAYRPGKIDNTTRDIVNGIEKDLDPHLTFLEFNDRNVGKSSWIDFYIKGERLGGISLEHYNSKELILEWIYEMCDFIE
jgi:hypothetical protein